MCPFAIEQGVSGDRTGLHSGQVNGYARPHPVPTITAHTSFTRMLAASRCAIDDLRNERWDKKEKTSPILEIGDDGIGFDPASVLIEMKHYGLPGLRESARLLQGSLQIKSMPGEGTKMQFLIAFVQKDNEQEHKELISSKKEEPLQ